MALAVVAGGVALWATPGQRAVRAPVHETAVARPAAPAPAIVAARQAPPAPAAVAALPPPPPPPKPAAAQAQAPAVVPLPPVRVAEAEPEPMSSELQASLDQWLISTYRHCWKSPAGADGDPYFPKIRVAFKNDGALAGPPRLVNPPSDPALRPQADAALRAVKACDPLHVPDKYAPYYRQWKTKTVYFDGARS